MFAHTVLLQPIIGFLCPLWCWKSPHAVLRRTLSRGKRRDSCGHGSADLKSRRLRGVIRFLQADEILGYLAEEASSRVELHDNASPHTALLREQLHWDIFDHPRYSPDLALSDFFLFPKMEYLAGKSFANDLKNAVGGHMAWRGYTQTDAKVQVP